MKCIERSTSIAAGSVVRDGFCFLIAVLSLAAFGSPALSSGLANARAIGMAGAYTSLARGVECTSFNPANLGLETYRQTGLQLFGLGLSISNNSFSLDDYNHYTGATLTESEKDELLAKIPADGLKVTADAEATAIGVGLGGLAVSLSALGAAEINLGRTPMELLLKGNALADTVDLDGMYGEGYAFAAFNVSYGQSLYKYYDRQLAIGGTFRYLRGLAYEEVTEIDGHAVTLPAGFEGLGSLTARTATGGTGYAVDLGTSLRLSKSYTVGLTVFNFLSHIRWTSGTEERRYAFAFDSVTAVNMNADSIVTSTDTTVAIGSFVTTLPATIKAGLAKTTGSLLWAVDWEQGFRRGAGISTRPRLSAGAEYRLLHLLPLRAGFAIGGKPGTTYAAGIGLAFAPVTIDVGAANYNAVSGSFGKGLNLAVTCGIRF